MRSVMLQINEYDDDDDDDQYDQYQLFAMWRHCYATLATR